MRGSILAVLVTVAYLALGSISATLAHAESDAWSVWLASGFVVGMLIALPRARWPWILLGGSIGAVVFSLVLGSDGVEALGYGMIELVSSGVGAVVGTLVAGRPASLESPREVAALVVAVGVASLVGAAAAAFWSVSADTAPFADVFLVWSASAIAGGLLVAAMVVAWLTFRPKRSGGLAMPPFLGGLVAAALFVGAVWLHFGAEGEVGLADELTYLPLLLLVVVALLWGARGASTVAFVGALIAVTYTVAGRGPFVGSEGLLGDDVLEVQAYVMTMALAALIVAALVAGQRRAMLDAQAWRTRFEAAIGAHGLIAYEWDPASGHIALTGDAQRLLGVSLARLGTLADWIAQVEPRDRDAVQERFDERAKGQGGADTLAYAMLTGEGSSVAVTDEARAIRDHDGTLHRVVGIVRPAAQSAA